MISNEITYNVNNLYIGIMQCAYMLCTLERRENESDTSYSTLNTVYLFAIYWIHIFIVYTVQKLKRSALKSIYFIRTQNMAQRFNRINFRFCQSIDLRTFRLYAKRKCKNGTDWHSIVCPSLVHSFTPTLSMPKTHSLCAWTHVRIAPEEFSVCEWCLMIFVKVVTKSKLVFFSLIFCTKMSVSCLKKQIQQQCDGKVKALYKAICSLFTQLVSLMCVGNTTTKKCICPKR